MVFYQEFMALIDVLDQAGIDYAVCGGVAVTLHGYPRFTKDIDMLVRKRDLDSVSRSVRKLGFVLESGRIPFGVGTPREREIYRISKAEDDEILTLDLLVVGPVFEEVWRTRGMVEWESRTIRVVSLGGLMAMKELAGRTQDLLDIEKLKAANFGQETDDG